MLGGCYELSQGAHLERKGKAHTSLMFQSIPGRRAAGRDSQLAIDRAHMEIDGNHADDELFGNLRARQTLCKQDQYIHLSGVSRIDGDVAAGRGRSRQGELRLASTPGCGKSLFRRHPPSFRHAAAKSFSPRWCGRQPLSVIDSAVDGRKWGAHVLPRRFRRPQPCRPRWLSLHCAHGRQFFQTRGKQALLVAYLVASIAKLSS